MLAGLILPTTPAHAAACTGNFSFNAQLFRSWDPTASDTTGARAEISYEPEALCTYQAGDPTQSSSFWSMIDGASATGWIQIGYVVKNTGVSNRFFWMKNSSWEGGATAFWGTPSVGSYISFEASRNYGLSRCEAKYSGILGPDNQYGDHAYIGPDGQGRDCTEAWGFSTVRADFSDEIQDPNIYFQGDSVDPAYFNLIYVKDRSDGVWRQKAWDNAGWQTSSGVTNGSSIHDETGRFHAWDTRP